MKSSKNVSSVWTVLVSYKIFSSVFTIYTLILLSRIPLGSFNDSSLLDSVAHFLLPATGTALLYKYLETTALLPSLQYSYQLLVMTLLGIATAVVWEIFELTVDLIFGTNWQLNNIDTMTDLILGVAGTLLGSILFLRIYKEAI